VREYNSVPPTRLTQRHRTEAKGKVWAPRVKFSKADHLCRGCGKRILDGSKHCSQCAVSSATERFIDAARVGRQTANGPEVSGEAGEHATSECPGTARVEAVGPTKVANGSVLCGEDSTACRIPISISYRSTSLSFAVVRWPHPRGLSAPSEALAGPRRIGPHS
jgi:hypothetical protein